MIKNIATTIVTLTIITAGNISVRASESNIQLDEQLTPESFSPTTQLETNNLIKNTTQTNFCWYIPGYGKICYY